MQVEATNVETNVVFSGETNADGRYNIPNLPPGTYRVIVRKFAFRTVVKPGVELHVQDVVALNFSMELGSVTQSVTVEAGAPLIQAGPQRGGAFVSREVSESASGVTESNLPGTRSAGSHRTCGQLLCMQRIANDEATLFSVNGARTRANNYLLDSTENNDIVFTGVAQPFNIADAVEEVSVQTGNFGVEFGRAGGGVFNVVTKSGTNSSERDAAVALSIRTFQLGFQFRQAERHASNRVQSERVWLHPGRTCSQEQDILFWSFSAGQSSLSPLYACRSDGACSRHTSLFISFESAVGSLPEPFGSVARLGQPDSSAAWQGSTDRSGPWRRAVCLCSAGLREINAGPQWMVRLDHNRSEEHRLAFRYIYDSRTDSPRTVFFPGFYIDRAARNHNLLFTDQLHVLADLD